MQLQAHMNASNSSNNCSYMATALCTLAETVEARYVHIRLSDSIHQGIIKGTNVTWMSLSSESVVNTRF